MFLDKDEIKNHLTPEQIFKILEDFGGEPQMKDDCIISQTICHNSPHEGSHKLYYFFNTRLFICFTNCGTFDIFDLIIKIKEQAGEKWTLYNAVTFVVNYFSGFLDGLNFHREESQEWKIVERWETANTKVNSTNIQLEQVEGSFINNMPQPRILDWEKEGIDYSILQRNNIHYDSTVDGIIIPHYDKDNRLVGIRERVLSERELEFGKYRPLKYNGNMYNHPLGYNLYNLNNSKNNIKMIKTAIILEAEKGCMQYANLFGAENDISVAACGSTISAYQIHLLLEAGANELIIAFDRQYQKIGDKEWELWVKKLTSFHTRYSSYIQISFIFDTHNLLGYKDSPTDRGKDIFIKLFKERIYL